MILVLVTSAAFFFGLSQSTENLLSWPDPYIKSRGEIWPMPQRIEKYGTVFFLDPEKFVIESSSECDIIKEAIKRYSKRIFFVKSDNIPDTNRSEDVLSSLKIVVDGDCPEGVPQLGMDESYKLNVTSTEAMLRSAEVWGALRGLESFSHMVYYNSSSGHYIQAAVIKDFPRFPHRGVLLDTSRHFLSVNALKSNIDLMAQNKFNVFHWHIVDNEAFPYGSEATPQLTKGAYSDSHKFSIAEIKDIIGYARLRGIRVIPEFDTPGHMKSWGKGIENLLTRCFNQHGQEIFDRSLIDPTQESTWDVLLSLFQEVFRTFPDHYVHLGGDEVEFWITECWQNNKNITDFMKIYELRTMRDLEEWYFTKLLNMLNGPRVESKKKFLVWQEVLDEGIDMEGVVAQVWKGNSEKEQMDEMNNVTAKGHYAIFSSCWYLDYVSSTADWIKFYSCDPQNFNGTAEQRSLVLGGEAALWGEWVDESNVVPRLWPRASAVAERLWSPRSATTDAFAAWPRLYEMQCRMASRGYSVQPMNGPGFCEFEYHANLPI